MPYLQHEKTRVQTEIQRADEEIAALNARLQAQQQTIATAAARVQAAQNRLTETQAPIPGLEAAAASAEQRVENSGHRIDEHAANEPESVIETEHGPRPNPEWRIWKRELDRLIRARDQAQADASAAHARLSEARAQVSRATGELHNAERQLAEARAAAAAIEQAIRAAQQKQAAAQKELDLLNRSDEEISRDPLDRKTLEQIAAELSGRATVLHDAYQLARVQNEIANETLASLNARRAQITAALERLNSDLSPAQAELNAARAALTAATRNIERHFRRGPRG
jgi:DNA repair exonuclease SbcCD ATPase subunit